MATTGTKVLRSLQPDLYRTNAFRITGLHVEASSMDFRKRLEKIQIMEKLGMQHESAHGCMALVPPPDAVSIRAAIERLNDPEQRIIEEFFWFWPHKEGDTSQDKAIHELEEGNLDAAITRWQHSSADSTDEVAIHNLAVLYHAKALDSEAANTPDIELLWGKAWKYWRLLQENAAFWSRLRRRIQAIDDPRLSSAFASTLQQNYIRLLAAINVHLAYQAASTSNDGVTTRHLSLLRASGLDPLLQTRLLENALQPVRDSLKTYAANVDSQARQNPAGSNQVIRQYLQNVRPLLATLSGLLPVGNSIRDGCNDQVATTVRGLLVGFGNATKNWRECRTLLMDCKSMAVSASALSLIDEDLKIVNDNFEASLCWFCKQYEPDKRKRSRVPMHGDTNVEYYGTGTRTRWRTQEVEVPRCTRCLKVHLARRSILATLLGLAVLPFVLTEEGFVVAAALTIAMFIGWQTGPFLRFPPLDKLFGILGAGVSPEREKRKFPVVEYLKTSGWNYGSRPSSVGMEPTSIAKGALWLVIFIVVLIVVYSLKDDSSVSTSSTGSRTGSYTSSSSYRPPATSSQANFSQPAASPSGTDTRRQVNSERVRTLRSEIDSSKLRIDQLESQIQACKSTITDYNDQISSDSARLEQMLSDDRAGLYVNRDDYEVIRSRHNRNVRLHNDKVRECKAVVEEHDSLVDTFNTNVREYNRLVGAR